MAPRLVDHFNSRLYATRYLPLLVDVFYRVTDFTCIFKQGVSIFTAIYILYFLEHLPDLSIMKVC